MSRSREVWFWAGFAACSLAGCNLVLGIDDVSSANGPDSGQRVSGVSADPDAAHGDDEDSGAGPD